MEVVIGISNRHVHLTEEDYKKLFGDLEFTKYKDLNQPGQYSSNSFVTLKNDDREIQRVRVIGPLRDYTQVEISQTDARQLKINPPVRTSGDLKGSASITLVGPKGQIDLDEGCIIAERHIHILEEQAKLYGLIDKEVVSVLLPGEKGGVINNVHLKIAPNSYYEMHLDTDDANAHLLKNGDIGIII